MSKELRIICMDADAPPLLVKGENGDRRGFESDAARVVASEMGREVVWVIRQWGELMPALHSGEGDAIWAAQSITPERREIVDFTRPYGIFDEAVLVRVGSGIKGPDDFAGRPVGALANSSCMAVVETFPGSVPVPLPFEESGESGSADNLLTDMVEAVRSGKIDALVEDEAPLARYVEEGTDLEFAFRVPSHQPWAVAVSKDRPDLRDEIDAAVGAVIANGELERVWNEWMPSLEWPFAQGSANAG